MTPKWLPGLTRARRAQEDAALARLVSARRGADRAETRARAEAARLAALQERDAEENATAFVAAAVAAQSAAATLAAAEGAALRADAWVRHRQQELTEAGRQRHTAEELLDRAEQSVARAAAVRDQAHLDEAAAAVRRRAEQRSGT
jgi:hypothetical protein